MKKYIEYDYTCGRDCTIKSRPMTFEAAENTAHFRAFEYELTEVADGWELRTAGGRLVYEIKEVK